jgi:hypothetical protein
MSYEGWEGAIRFPVKQVVAERMIDVDGADALGNASKTVFYTRSLPITDNAGAVTNVITNVILYYDGTPQSAWGTMVGAEGKITTTAAPGSGVVITMTYYFARTVGYAQGMTIKHSGNITPVREVGNRLPVELKEGNIVIGVTVERCWLNRDLLGKEWHPGASPEFDIDLCPGGIGSGKPYMRVTGKFTSWNATERQDGILVESSELVGRVIAVGTQA